MAKKASKPPKVENLTFKKFLLTLTVSKIKDLINLYNDDFAPEDKPIKGYSQFRKKELIEFLDESILQDKKDILIQEFEEDLIEELVIKATSLITGEHNVESIKNAAIIAGGKGYNVWFSSKYAAFKASLHIENNSVQRSCNCKIGSLGGLCIHQMAIYLMLLSKNMINRTQIPFTLNKELYDSIQKRLELHASQKLFKIEPSIMFEDGYKIYVNNNLVTLEWGGDFPGKTTKDISRKDIDVDRWISEKVTDLIVRYIKVRKKEGKPSKIVIDSYGIISKIMEYEDLVEKILRKFSALEELHLPTDKNGLEEYLREGLKESSVDLEIEPPFSAYEGEEPYIFVSYTHKDKAEVYPIIDKLNQEGLKLWYDEGIHLSTDWCNTIAEKLMGCDLFLSFISPHINESENSKDEIFLATEENKPFIAVYLKETDLVPGIKMRIRRIQGIMKYQMNEAKAFEKLTTEIEQLIDQ
ncbi:MAG: TIR domain-containing protein [Candidatus Lokiarchaeota archaeon]|nr:TIR domain-containing protein [Candidatus Lokiarchaeota archaeon]